MRLGASDVLVRQSEAGECGLACLATIARHHGDMQDISSLRRRFPVSSRGASLKDIIAIADQMGFHSRPLRSDVRSLSRMSLPAILHWDMNHYVVLESVKTGLRGIRYTLLDPAYGTRVLEEEALGNHFTGIVLELTPTANFKPKKQAPTLKLTQLWTKMSGLWPALARVLALSLVIQAVSLIAPFYLQLAIDTALPAVDADLLKILAVGFGGLAVLSTLSSWMRSRLVLNLSNHLGFQTALNLFRHTIFLPTSWFEKRHLGDVVSRFGSLLPITDILSRGLVSSLVDGMLALTTFVMMVIYSPVLAAMTVGIVIVYGSMKAAFYNSMKLTSANLLTAQAIESSVFMENIRGIRAIKVFCQEGNRQRHWQNKKADFVNGSLKMGRLTAGFETINIFVIAAENILFVYVSVRMVMSGTLSLGMMFAYQAYKLSFVGSITRLIDQLINYKLLDVHLNRISDIVLEDPESETQSLDVAPIKSIYLQNVSFSYGVGLPLVLSNVSLEIECGRTTVITGVSGGGKTTLLKILCGLLQPTSGRVMVNEIPLSEYGIRNYRSRLGVVSQDDCLFAGTLAENIAFFDPDYEVGHVEQCGRLAAVHDDIMRMPMKYDTMVGDMGSNLSGGQKQRVLLARALYKAPDVLMLDEGTAHLDVQTESQVVAAMKQMQGTRILVAHRPETIEMADAVVDVTNGRARTLKDCSSLGKTLAPV